MQSVTSRKSRARIVLGFALALIVLDLVIYAAADTWRRHDPDEYRDRLAACRNGTWDCMLVGGSPVYNGLDPMLLEGTTWRGQTLQRVFNIGLPGGTTTDVWHATKHGAAKAPRLLVYGITASDINDARNEPHGARHLIDLDDVWTWWQLRPQSGWWCTKHYLRSQLTQTWNLYEHRKGMRLWLARQLPFFDAQAAVQAETNLSLSDRFVSRKGFTPRETWSTQRLDLLRQKNWRPPPFAFLNGFSVGEHLSYLERLIDWTEANRSSLILVDMPVTPDLEEQRYPEIFARYRTAVQELADRRGVVFLDGGRKNVGLGDEHFADLIHLNEAGARRLTGWLRLQIADLTFAQAGSARP